jgi:hypothetical protein
MNKEKKIDEHKKLMKLVKKKEREDIDNMIRAEKNMERMRKQENLTVFIGRRQVFRSGKKQRGKEKNYEDELDEEELDYIRYVGN